MPIIPSTGPYERKVREINWEEIPSAKFDDNESAILMVAESEDGSPQGTYAIIDPEITIPQFLDFTGLQLVERIDLEGSILLIVRRND